MALSNGTRLGPYEIVAPIGAGGMGEVYRARDPRLGREVALKIVPESAVKDPDRRRRFEAEARAASALNHPNIIAVYDIGEENGTPYIVYELIDGVSLRALIAEAPVANRKLLDLAAQIADGLAAAHAAGITHRDLKPDNIMVTREGRAKILDFGLAKASPSPAKPSDETVTTLNTEPGVVMGTIGYMSPEQCRAQGVDFRSDQFAFGALLYELATGKNAFARATTADTMSAILKEDPESLQKLNAKLPPHLTWIIDRLLAKDPLQRYDSTKDLFREIRDLRDHLSDAFTAPAIASAPPRRRSKLWPVLVAGLLAGAATNHLLFSEKTQQLRYTPFATDIEAETQPAWSPDGKAIAYLKRVNGRDQVFVKSLESMDPVQLTKDSADCYWVFWAPDGARVYFGRQNALWMVGVAGGAPEKVLEDVGQAAISPDGKTFVFLKRDSKKMAWLKPVAGGDAKPYGVPFAASEPTTVTNLQFSPDGSQVVVMHSGGEVEDLHLVFLPVPPGKPRRWPGKLTSHFTAAGTTIAWHSSQEIVVPTLRDGNESYGLSLIRPDDPFIREATSNPGMEWQPSASSTGRIAFVGGGSKRDIVEVVLPERGEVKATINTVTSTTVGEANPSYSPDGAMLAYATRREIWLRSIQGNWRRRLAVPIGPVAAFTRPRISPDGQRISYQRSDPEGHDIWIVPTAGGAPVRIDPVSRHQHADTWSPDGNWIAYCITGEDGVLRLVKTPSGGTGRPIILAEAASNQWNDWSPDGKWIAFTNRDGVQLVSSDGKDRRLLSPVRLYVHGFTRDSSKIIGIARKPDRRYKVVSITVDSGVEKDLADLDISPDAQLESFTLHPDGKRFLTTQTISREDIWILDGVKPLRKWPFLPHW